MNGERTTTPPLGRNATLAHILRRRGFELRTATGDSKLFLPDDPAGREELYDFLLHYSFRLVLRDVLVHRASFSADDLQKYCSAQTASRYVAVLEAAGLVEPTSEGRTYRLAKDTVDSLGDTLEWLTAEILRRELGMEAAWGVRLENAAGGGDYDVLATADGALMYVETKSAPPRHVHRREIAAFFARLEALRPHAAILVEDTKLRMSDKLVVMFEEQLAKRPGAAAARMSHLEDETFVLGNELFLTNAAPDLAAALRRCVVHYFRTRPYCLSE